MRIAIDGVFFQLHKGGIGRVWLSLLTEWAHTSFAARIVILDRAGTFPRIAGYQYLTVPLHSYDDLDGDRRMLQEVCTAAEVTLFVSTYYSRPSSLPTLLLVHDLIPEVLGADLRQPKWVEKSEAIAHAAAFAAISHSTADDLARFYPLVARQEVSVIHLGVDPLFRPADGAAVAAFCRSAGIDSPYFLYVGSRASYKNPLLLYKAFAQLCTRGDYQLVFTGETWQDADLLALVPPGKAVMAGHLTDQQLAVAYSGAVALVYPSYYEGFGLPVLEAMACGCPVIAHRTSSLPEVGGDALMYLPADNEDDLLKAMLAVAAEPLRSLLVSRGVHRSRLFSWHKAAAEMMNTLLGALRRSMPE